MIEHKADQKVAAKQVKKNVRRRPSDAQVKVGIFYYFLV